MVQHPLLGRMEAYVCQVKPPARVEVKDQIQSTKLYRANLIKLYRRLFMFDHCEVLRNVCFPRLGGLVCDQTSQRSSFLIGVCVENDMI